MIIKGSSCGGGGASRALGNYLSHQGQNEKVQLLEVRGTIDRTPVGALAEMDAYALGTNCRKPLYHAMINPDPSHPLSPSQQIEAVDALEQKLGLEGHARVIVMHEKHDRQHLHVVWSRIDLDQMRSVSDSHNYRRHEEVARDLERRFGHERVQGAHAERDGVPRPERSPSRAERAQEEKTGISGKEVRSEVTALFRSSDGPAAFKSALEQHGYTLAKGDRRDLVIMDAGGGVHSLARRIDGVRTTELREWMKDLDQRTRPTITEAQRERKERIDNFARDDGASLVAEIPAAEFETRAAEEKGLESSPVVSDGREDGVAELPNGNPLRVFDKLSGAAMNLADYLGDFFLGGGEKPRQDPGLVEQLIADRKAAAALANIRDSIRDGKAIGVDDVRCLRPDDIRAIRDHGDGYLREMVSRLDAQREQERELGRGRER